MKRSSLIGGMTLVLSCGFVLTAGCVGEGGGDGGIVYRVIPEITLGDSTALEAAVTAMEAVRLGGGR